MVQHSAIKMLYTRVRLILDYLKAVEGGKSSFSIRYLRSFLFIYCYTLGELPKDHQVLREINSLCHQLPAIDTLQFREDFHMVSLEWLFLFYGIRDAACV